MKQQADVIIVGEASSEFALKKADLISCKARVEIKAVDTVSGEILALGRETDAGVDVAESTAAKTAIQKPLPRLPSGISRRSSPNGIRPSSLMKPPRRPKAKGKAAAGAQ